MLPDNALLRPTRAFPEDCVALGNNGKKTRFGVTSVWLSGLCSVAINLTVPSLKLG